MSPERAVELCTRKLAQLLCDHRRNRGEDGTPEGDWLTAEAWLRDHPEVMTNALFSSWPNSFTDLDFEHTYGEMIYVYAFQPLVAGQDPAAGNEQWLKRRQEISVYLRGRMPAFMGVEATTA